MFKSSMLSVFVISLLLIVSCNISSSKVDDEAKEKLEAENEQDGMEKYMEYLFRRTKDPALNMVPYERLAIAQKEANDRGSYLQRTFGNLNWIERGPNNIGGRTRAILEDKNDPTGNTIFAGSVGGGIWKCTNFKSSSYTWTKMNDYMQNLAVCCLAQHPTNPSIMYAGTGEGYFNSDAIRGGGIFTSTDGGNNWQPLPSTIPNASIGNTSFYYVQDIAVASNGDIYASSRGATSCDGGIYKSTNGGSSWSRVVGTNFGGSCQYTTGNDIDIATNGDIYVTTGLQGSSSNSFGKVFKSAASLGSVQGNLGQWTDITPTPPTGESGFRRVELASAPSSPTTLYVLCQKYNSSGVSKFFKSTDAGSSWTAVNIPSWCDQGTTKSDFTRGQAWYDLAVEFSPTNPNRLFIGGVDVMRSTDGGFNFSQATRWSTFGCGSYPYVHADIHNILFLGNSLNDMVIASDGGLFYSADGGITFTNRNLNYNITQYYAVAIHPSAGSNYMLAGAQDNGSHIFRNTGINSVSYASGGDGAFCFIDQVDPTYQITSYVYSNYYISRNGGVSFSVSLNDANGDFINPGDYDSRSKILYCGYSAGKMGRVTNITSGTPSIEGVSISQIGSKYASAFKVDPNTLNRLYIGVAYSSANLIRVDNANTSFLTTSNVSIPGAYGNVSSIDVEDGNANHLLVTLSNFGVTSVYESTDGGITWTNIEGDLPDMPVNFGIFLPSADKRIALATAVGVWTTGSAIGASTSWMPDNNGMANVSSDMLKFRKSDSTIAVATHGRGVFTTSLGSALPLKLVGFSGNIQNDLGVLNWKTSSEINTDQFIIEKSVDGKEYSRIGTVKAAGFSSNVKAYNFVDKSLVKGINFYRLKMVDKDGKFTYSNVVILKIDASNSIPQVVNNPFGNYIDIRFAKVPEGEVLLQLRNAAGALVKTQTFNNIPGSLLRMEVGNTKLTSNSVYLLSIYTQNTKNTIRVIKE